MRARLACGVLLAAVGCFSDPPDVASDSGESTDATASDSTISDSTSDPTSATVDSTIGESTGSSSTTLGDDSTGSPECTTAGGIDDACDPTTPYCVDGTCTGCGGLPAGCIAVDPAAPVCDPRTQRCGPCDEHDQCDSGACRISTGECFAEANRLWVDAAADCSGALGTEAAPFCTIPEALEVIDAQVDDDAVAVFVAGSATRYDFGSLPLFGRPIAFVGSTQGLEVRIGGPAEPVVVGGPEAYFARVALESDGTLVLDCLQGELWLDDTVLRNGTVLLDVGYDCEVRARRSVFHDGTEHGLVVESGGIVALEQSEIRSNAGAMLLEGTANIDRSVVRDNYLLGGIDVVGGTLRMTNSMMFANVYQLGAIRATNVSEVDLVYVTVLADSVACEGAGPGMTIRNSAVQYVECAQASIDDSLVTTSALGQGTGNVAFPASDAELEEIFVNPLGGDLHLEDSPPEWLLGIAVRRATDPAIDIDGDPRPRVDQDDYPGADVP